MSKYTILLKNVCDIFSRPVVESWFEDYDLNDFLTPSQIDTINKSNTWSKQKLSKMIVNHYLNYEIGMETPALFREEAKTLMNELMEKYSFMIYSNAIEYDPLINIDLKEEYGRTLYDDNTSTGTSNSSSQANGTGLSISSDTPQTNIIKENILKGDYASSTSGNENSTSGSENISSNSTDYRNISETYTRKTKGNSGVYTTNQKLIQQYREIIITINNNIIKDLNILFMQIY